MNSIVEKDLEVDNSKSVNEIVTNNIEVIIRIRPLNTKEIEMGISSIITYLGSKSLLLQCPTVGKTDTGLNRVKKKKKTHYEFTNIVSEKETQMSVYSKGPDKILEEVIKGYSGTIFAYGSTGSGKTYT